MSVPPNNYPPNNYPPNNYPPGGYSPIPPAHPSGGGKGWKLFGFGCLGLFLLLAVGGVLLVQNIKSKLANPQKSDVVGTVILTSQAAQQGTQLQQAIIAYHTQHNTYPKSLMDLYTDGSIDGKLLHNALDDSPDPAHISWRYTPPDEGAPGSIVILEEQYHVTVGSTNPPDKLAITLDGKSISGAAKESP